MKDNNVIKKLNNFQVLKLLHIRELNFKNPFSLLLTNLSVLVIGKCKNIMIGNNFSPDLNHLILEKSFNIVSQSLLNFSKLNFYVIKGKDKNYTSLINYSSLSKLGFYYGDIFNFISLENSPELDNVEIYQTNKNLEIEIKLIEKIINLKKLEKLSLHINKIEDSIISKLIGQNNSLVKLSIKLILQQDTYKFDGFLSKFKNLQILEIELPNKSSNKLNNLMLHINENLNSEISKFKIILKSYYNCIFFCGPYERLTEIAINIKEINNFTINFPIFGDNCIVSFIFLSLFEFKSDDLINQNLLNNIYNNIKYMPNLKSFKLDCISKVQKEFYHNFVNKILSLFKIKTVYFSLRENIDIKKQSYSVSELIELYPEIDFYKYDDICVQKF